MNFNKNFINININKMSNEFNINAEPFYPPGEKEKEIKINQYENLERELYKIKENIWWFENNNMFDDSFEDEIKYFKIKKSELKQSHQVKK